jgi:hypothetical protein
MSNMSQTPTPINTTPLFPTSLRRWQAAWRAEKVVTGGDADRPQVAVRPQRFKRRTRRGSEKPVAS